MEYEDVVVAVGMADYILQGGSQVLNVCYTLLPYLT